MRAIALLTLFGITLSALVACSGKANNAAGNAAQNAAGAMGNAAHNAAGAMGNAAHNTTQGASNAAGGAAGAMGNAANAAGGAMTAKPNCGAVAPVWVNLKTKVYHQPGSTGYGTTMHGEYLCPAQARAQGFRPAGGMRTHKAAPAM
jgi:hypothetical protein